MIQFLILTVAMAMPAQTVQNPHPKADEIFQRLIHRDVNVRLKASKDLDKLKYEDLSDFQISDSSCAKLVEGPLPKCSFMNHAVYHLIGVFKKFALQEMNPKSAHFCQSNQKDNLKLCPYLSKLRWLIFNQFGNPIVADEDLPPNSNHVTERKLQKMAFDALKEVTDIEFKTLEDLRSYRHKTVEDSESVWTIVQLNTSEGFYRAPILHFLEFNKAKKSFIRKKVIFPFKITSKSEYEQVSDPLSYAESCEDFQIIPQTKMAVLDKVKSDDDETHIIYFINLNTHFEIKQKITISSKNLPGITSSLGILSECLKSSELHFPLKEGIFTKSGNGKKISCDVSPVEK